MISLGIDIGGTGCKCVAFSDTGVQLALDYLEYPNPTGNPNLSAHTLRQGVFTVIKNCVAQLADPQDVVAVTVSSFGESFVPVDADGAPLTDIIMYYADSDNDAFARTVQKIGAENISAITRVLPDATYSLAKMLTAPPETDKFLFVAGYMVYVLCGRAVCDVSLACRSLLYDVQAGCWSAQLLAGAGIDPQKLPTVLPTGSAAGAILPRLADQLGLPQNTRIVMGSHDQIVNALGAGVAAVGDAVDTTGTCECLTPLFGAVPGQNFIRHNFACVPYLDTGGYVTYAYNISGGAAVRWFRDALACHLQAQAEAGGCSIYDVLNRVCPAQPTGLLVLPFVQGMGATPDIAPGATAAITGLTASTTLPQIYRGLLEGLCYEMRCNMEALADDGVQLRQLFAAGGGARSAVWLQIKADVWGCPVIPVKTQETGALGSAILGFAAVTDADAFAMARRFASRAEPILPDPARHAYYTEQYKKYKKLRKFYLENFYREGGASE